MLELQENRIILGKWEESIALIPDGSVSLVITDPPYACTPHAWDKHPYWDFFWSELARVCGDDGQAWIFVRMPWSIEVHQSALKNKWKYVQERIWEKQNGGGATVGTFRKVHENIWHYKRPKAKTFNLDAIREPKTTTGNKSVAAGKGCATNQYMKSRVAYVDDGLRMPKSVIFCHNLHQSKESLGHSTQKPEKIIRPLVLYSSNEGELVLDPFAGTGTTLAVAKACGRRWIGMEMTEEWHRKAEVRLGAVPVEPVEVEPVQGSKGLFDEL